MPSRLNPCDDSDPKLAGLKTTVLVAIADFRQTLHLARERFSRLGTGNGEDPKNVVQAMKLLQAIKKKLETGRAY